VKKKGTIKKKILVKEEVKAVKRLKLATAHMQAVAKMRPSPGVAGKRRFLTSSTRAV
jgi:hypothetical protein